MVKRKQKWEIGDVFTVQTLDGKYVVGQIVGQEVKVLNSVTVAFFNQRFDSEDLAKEFETSELDKVISVVFSTRDLLDSGKWHVINNKNVHIPIKYMPFEHLRSAGFVGAKVIGSGNMEEFLNAYYALSPWDDWYDPNYLDQLLISSDKKPSNLVYKE